jgi:hypothetical protein
MITTVFPAVSATSAVHMDSECVHLRTTVDGMQMKVVSTAVARQHCCSTRFVRSMAHAMPTTTASLVIVATKAGALLMMYVLRV